MPYKICPSRATAGSTTLLLVDDDDGWRSVGRAALAAQGFRVLEADNGMDALLMAAGHEGFIHLLITDLGLTRIGGALLAEAFREIWPAVQVLYTSESAEEVSRAGLPPDCTVLMKPFSSEALMDAVDEALAAAV